jgi:catechol 2,3-dioxygenase-like lactoylglutathione lyase family enzyme
MSNTTDRAQTPTGVNHLVLNVRDLEESHRFWTEMIGFKCCRRAQAQGPAARCRCASTAA